MPAQPKREGREHSGSGIDENGDWTPQFPGQRPPLRPGHSLSLQHGSYSVLHLKPRAQEIAAILREQVVESERFTVAIDSAAMVGARVETSFAALTEAAPGT